MIPQCNPLANYLKYKDEIDRAISDVLNKGRYILGSEVEAFENEFASFNQSKGCVGVANGTDALLLSLMALDLKPGDKVITVSHTAVATVNAICRLGLIPIFVDVDENNYTLDPKALSRELEKDNKCQIKAVIAVHLYGNVADIITIEKLCQSKGVSLIEDCAQAHGAEINGKKVGNFGVFGTFSFYPTKNLGALGDGGAVISNDKALISKLKSLREYGWQKRYVSDTLGINSRLDEVQAAALRVKLKYVHDDIALRRKYAKQYDDGINNKRIILPNVSSNIRHVYHQYVIQSEDRDKFQKRLKNERIATAIHYPVPVHLQSAYAEFDVNESDLQITAGLVNRILSLPMFPELTKDQVTTIIDVINGF